MRRNVAGALEQAERDVEGNDAEAEDLADQPVDPILIIERVADRSHSASAVPEQEQRQLGIVRACQFDRLRQVGHVIVDTLGVEPLGIGPPAPAQIECSDRDTVRDEFLGSGKIARYVN